MENIVDALKAMGKATSVELAARLQISREEVLNELWELRRSGVVDQNLQVWTLASDGAQREQKTPAAEYQRDNKEERKLREVVSRQERAPLNRSDILSAFAHCEEMTTVEIATAVGRADSVRSLVSAMEKLCRTGLVIKLGQGKGCKWKLVKKSGENLPTVPETEPVALSGGKSESATVVVDLPQQKTQTKTRQENIVQSLPSFTATRSDDLILPSLHMANRELRRAKSHVQKWERVCAALRELNKHRDIVARLCQEATSE
ncbi:DUF1627 domain-containing protein [Escherichia coli]|uniref:DUF1627 domain-containing protein n=1 Tax=Escherichia coli TaxID=562 RepID=UPI000BEA0435|nr:DUF1627 domain-containing protein [Escherichia coli]EFE9119466.1 DUF1627 domain-containing protein [Escherichia coli]